MTYLGCGDKLCLTIFIKCKFLLTKSASFWSSPARWTLTDCVHDYRMQERPLTNTIYNAGYDVDRVNLAAVSAHLTKAA
mgnify:CR=1 FL=1